MPLRHGNRPSVGYNNPIIITKILNKAKLCWINVVYFYLLILIVEEEYKIKIKGKLMILGIIPVIFFTILNFAFIIPSVERDIYVEKDKEIKYVVDSGYSILSYYKGLEVDGELTKEQAQRQAKAAINEIRYAGDGYLWIDDSMYNVVMHPINPALIGTNRKGEKDANGKLYIEEFINGAVKSGQQGYYCDYLFPKPGTKETYPKRGYHKYYEPWQWVISTGVYVDDVEALIAQKTRIMYGANALIILLTMLLIHWFSEKSIIKPLKQVLTKLNDMAENGGDLTQKIEATSKDEIGQLAHSVNKMTTSIRELLSQVVEKSQVVAASSQQLSANAQQTSASVNEVTATIGNVSIKSAEMAQIAEALSSYAQNANQHADQGNVGLAQVQQQMVTFENTTTSVGKVINELSIATNEITQIVDLINNIAEQTNLLALNAAIEAARAGEQGRGFAVVAEEVRKLAEQSGSAAKEIRNLIANIKSESDKAVSAIGSSAADAQNGIKVMNDVGQLFTQIIDNVKGMSVGIQKETANIEEITRAVHNVASGTEEQNAAMEEVAASVEGLTQLAASLQDLTAKFKL
jgi:methyl-accepting chemotaxis protein